MIRFVHKLRKALQLRYSGHSWTVKSKHVIWDIEDVGLCNVHRKPRPSSTKQKPDNFKNICANVPTSALSSPSPLAPLHPKCALFRCQCTSVGMGWRCLGRLLSFCGPCLLVYEVTVVACDCIHTTCSGDHTPPKVQASQTLDPATATP